MQKHRLQKMCQRELAEKKEEERDYWFNRLRSMTSPEQTWREKWLTKEEGGSSGEKASKVTPARGEDNLGSSDGNPESVTATRSWETATRSRVTATWTQVIATRVRRMTSKERSWSRGTPTWSSHSQQNSVRQGKTLWSWHWVQNVPCSRSWKIRART
jgi:hypothetical protein